MKNWQRDAGRLVNALRPLMEEAVVALGTGYGCSTEVKLAPSAGFLGSRGPVHEFGSLVLRMSTGPMSYAGVMDTRWLLRRGCAEYPWLWIPEYMAGGLRRLMAVNAAKVALVEWQPEGNALAADTVGAAVKSIRSSNTAFFMGGDRERDVGQPKGFKHRVFTWFSLEFPMVSIERVFGGVEGKARLLWRMRFQEDLGDFVKDGARGAFRLCETTANEFGVDQHVKLGGDRIAARGERFKVVCREWTPEQGFAVEARRLEAGDES